MAHKDPEKRRAYVKEYNRRYREKNKEKIRQLMRKYYLANREKEIEYAKEWRKNNKERHKKVRQKYLETTRGRLNSVKSSANTRNIEYKLSEKQALEIMEQDCHYCGDDYKIGIDRIDSNTGYIKNNCVPCCAMCNRMKSIFLYDDFITKCKVIADRLYKKDIPT